MASEETLRMLEALAEAVIASKTSESDHGKAIRLIAKEIVEIRQQLQFYAAVIDLVNLVAANKPASRINEIFKDEPVKLHGIHTIDRTVVITVGNKPHTLRWDAAKEAFEVRL